MPKKTNRRRRRPAPTIERQFLADTKKMLGLKGSLTAKRADEMLIDYTPRTGSQRTRTAEAKQSRKFATLVQRYAKKPDFVQRMRKIQEGELRGNKELRELARRLAELKDEDGRSGYFFGKVFLGTPDIAFDVLRAKLDQEESNNPAAMPPGSADVWYFQLAPEFRRKLREQKLKGFRNYEIAMYLGYNQTPKSVSFEAIVEKKNER